jgi:hypothetical protein
MKPINWKNVSRAFVTFQDNVVLVYKKGLSLVRTIMCKDIHEACAVLDRSIELIKENR